MSDINGNARESVIYFSPPRTSAFASVRKRYEEKRKQPKRKVKYFADISDTLNADADTTPPLKGLDVETRPPLKGLDVETRPPLKGLDVETRPPLKDLDHNKEQKKVVEIQQRKPDSNKTLSQKGVENASNIGLLQPKSSTGRHSLSSSKRVDAGTRSFFDPVIVTQDSPSPRRSLRLSQKSPEIVFPVSQAPCYINTRRRNRQESERKEEEVSLNSHVLNESFTVLDPTWESLPLNASKESSASPDLNSTYTVPFEVQPDSTVDSLLMNTTSSFMPADSTTSTVSSSGYDAGIESHATSSYLKSGLLHNPSLNYSEMSTAVIRNQGKGNASFYTETDSSLMKSVSLPFTTTASIISNSQFTNDDTGSYASLNQSVPMTRFSENSAVSVDPFASRNDRKRDATFCMSSLNTDHTANAIVSGPDMNISEVSVLPVSSCIKQGHDSDSQKKNVRQSSKLFKSVDVSRLLDDETHPWDSSNLSSEAEENVTVKDATKVDESASSKVEKRDLPVKSRIPVLVKNVVKSVEKKSRIPVPVFPTLAVAGSSSSKSASKKQTPVFKNQAPNMKFGGAMAGPREVMQFTAHASPSTYKRIVGPIRTMNVLAAQSNGNNAANATRTNRLEQARSVAFKSAPQIRKVRGGTPKYPVRTNKRFALLMEKRKLL